VLLGSAALSLGKPLKFTQRCLHLLCCSEGLPCLFIIFQSDYFQFYYQSARTDWQDPTISLQWDHCGGNDILPRYVNCSVRPRWSPLIKKVGGDDESDERWKTSVSLELTTSPVQEYAEEIPAVAAGRLACDWAGQHRLRIVDWQWCRFLLSSLLANGGY